MISVIQRARGALATYQLLRVPEWSPPQPWRCSREARSRGQVEETILASVSTSCSIVCISILPPHFRLSLSHLHIGLQLRKCFRDY